MNIRNVTQLHFYDSFLIDMYFHTADFFSFYSLTANMQFFKIQLHVFKIKKKFGPSKSNEAFTVNGGGGRAVH